MAARFMRSLRSWAMRPGRLPSACTRRTSTYVSPRTIARSSTSSTERAVRGAPPSRARGAGRTLAGVRIRENEVKVGALLVQPLLERNLALQLPDGQGSPGHLDPLERPCTAELEVHPHAPRGITGAFERFKCS